MKIINFRLKWTHVVCYKTGQSRMPENQFQNIWDLECGCSVPSRSSTYSAHLLWNCCISRKLIIVVLYVVSCLHRKSHWLCSLHLQRHFVANKKLVPLFCPTIHFLRACCETACNKGIPSLCAAVFAGAKPFATLVQMDVSTKTYTGLARSQKTTTSMYDFTDKLRHRKWRQNQN